MAARGLDKQAHQVLAQLGDGLADAIVRLEQLHGVGVGAPRPEQRPGDREVRGEYPRQLELRADGRHLVPGVEHVRHAVAREHGAVQRMQQVGVAKLDGVAEIPRQLAQKTVQLFRPAVRIGKVLPAHRLKLEHKASRVVAEHPGVGGEHVLLEKLGVQEVRVAQPREIAPTPVLGEAPRSDPIPHLAYAGEPGRQGSRVGGEHFLRGRLVERAIDAHGAEQRVRRVLLEPLRGLCATIRAMIDVARPAVVGPGRGAEFDVGGEAPGECYQIGGRRGQPSEVIEETWWIAAGHDRSKIYRTVPALSP